MKLLNKYVREQGFNVFRFIQADGVFLNSYDEDSVANFEKLISNINSEKNVSFTIFTGNNIAKPDPANLKCFLKKANKLKMPYYVVLGQKDVNKKKFLGKADYVKILRKKNSAMRKFKTPNYVFVKNGLVFIVADGSKEVIPMSNGYYRPDVLDWVNQKLDKYKNKNVVILQHYPLVPPCEKEQYYTFKADEYLKMLSEHKNVKAVISGHFGVNNEQEVDGIMHISTKNAPAYRIIDITDYDSDHPIFWSTIKE